MRLRTAVAGVSTALLLAVPASPVLAAGHGHASGPRERDRVASRQVRVQAFLLSGVASAFTAPAGSSDGSLTFTVAGGPFRSLRGKPLTVTVPPHALVVRRGTTPSHEVQAGDRVVVAGYSTTTKKASATAASVTWKAVRVLAVPRRQSPAPVPTPTPTETPAPTPTETPTPTPTETPAPAS